MSYVITAIVFTMIGFLGGILVYRKHQVKLNEAEAKARTLIK